MNRLLIIGPLPHIDYPQTYGGATISMKNLLDYCDRNNFPNGFIQTNCFILKYSLVFNLIRTLFHLLIKIKNYDVIMLNVSSRGALFSGPLVFFICKIFNRKIVFRKFGGGLDFLLERATYFAKGILCNSLLKSDLILAQTKYIVQYLHDLGNRNVLWFPTVRRAPDNQIVVKKEFKKRFVFISHVHEKKGVFEILKAANMLTSDYTFDIYGPIKDSKIGLDMFQKSKANYKGVLKPDEVVAKLKNYDVLVLPTNDEQEGYPGIIVEALGLGVPVIASRIRSIPEIVGKHNGVLIEPKSYIDLYNAIKSFNKENIAYYQEGSIKSSSIFNEHRVYSSLLEVIYNL